MRSLIVIIIIIGCGFLGFKYLHDGGGGKSRQSASKTPKLVNYLKLSNEEVEKVMDDFCRKSLTELSQNSWSDEYIDRYFIGRKRDSLKKKERDKMALGLMHLGSLVRYDECEPSKHVRGGGVPHRHAYLLCRV